MTLEERLEEARRRRAVVLAARSATRKPTAAETASTVLAAMDPSKVPPLKLTDEERRLTVVKAAPVPALRRQTPIEVVRAALWGLRARWAGIKAPALRPLAYGALALGVLCVAALPFVGTQPPQTLTAIAVPDLPAPDLELAPIARLPEPGGADPESGIIRPAAESPLLFVEPMRPAEPEAAVAVAALDVEPPSPEVVIAALPQIEAEDVPLPVDVSNALVRVFVPSRAAGTPEVSAMVAGMEGVDWRIERVGEVPFAVSATHVRYYHSDDRSVAERLASDTGGEARDFTGSATRPGEGRLELYVAGRGATRTQRRPVTRIEAELIRLIDDIFD